MPDPIPLRPAGFRRLPRGTALSLGLAAALVLLPAPAGAGPASAPEEPAPATADAGALSPGPREAAGGATEPGGEGSQTSDDAGSSAGSPAPEPSSEDRRSESYQIDPDAIFPPAPAEGVRTLAVPLRLREPAAAYSGVLRLSPRRAGRYYAAEVPMIAEHRPHGRGHRAEFRPAPSASPPAGGSGAPAASAPVATLRRPVLASPVAPALSSSFETTDTDTNVTNTGGFLFIPADPIGAAGPDHLVNVVNVTIRFHRKDGTLEFDDDLAAFFNALGPANFTFDPKVIYDHTSGRFVVVTLEQTDDAFGDPSDSSRILLAVSDDSDPNGTWFQAAIDAKTEIGGTEHWADYPGLAVDEEAIYVTANLFEFAGGGTDLGGVRLWVVEKGEGTGGLYDGGAATAALFDPYEGAGIETTTQPAHVFGVAPPGVGTFLASWGGIHDSVTGEEAIQIVRVDDPLGSPVFTQTFLGVGDIDDLASALPDAPQAKLPGDPVHGLQTNDRRALDAVWFQDSLWMTSTIDPRTGGPDAGEATAHWWEVDTTAVDALALADQGSVLGEDLAAETFTSFAAVAVNGAAQAAFGFSASSATTQAGSHYTTHLPSTAAGENTGSGTLRSGVAYYRRTFNCGSVSRWGDYSGMVVDPADGCFWVYNKHAIARGTATTDCSSPSDGTPDEDGRWGTAFGKLCPAGACSPDLRVEGTAYSTTVTERAGGQILTAGSVSVGAGADVTFQAGQRIILADGFSVDDGASFTAVIAPCS